MEETTVVCLCGSTRFKDTFLEWNKILTLKGWIVLMPGVFEHSGDEITEEQKIMLDNLHRLKIDVADLIFVIDEDGYIGQSTASEIMFADSLDKPIIYLSQIEEDIEANYDDEE